MQDKLKFGNQHTENTIGGTVVKNSPANAGGTRNKGSVPGLERSLLGGGNGEPTPLFLPVKIPWD